MEGKNLCILSGLISISYPETGTVNSGNEVVDADPGAETFVVSTEAVGRGSEAIDKKVA